MRAGRQWSVHMAAIRRYRKRLARDFDVVLDEVNTIPFFTPLWSRIPVVMFIHQLAREVWWYESAFPINALGYAIEPLYLRLYRRTPVVTVSQSTKRDLEDLGFSSPITVIPEGVEPIPAIPLTKRDECEFVYVGRIAPSKRIDHMIRALHLYHQATGSGTLWLIGSGRQQYKKTLEASARRLGLEPNVRFLGRVGVIDKYRVMARCQALLMTSVREGWGLVVSEANACGTPAIVYDVPGLRDSVRSESTGLVVPPNPQHLANAMIRMTEDVELHARLSANAVNWSSSLSFDEACRLVMLELERVRAA